MSSISNVLYYYKASVLVLMKLRYSPFYCKGVLWLLSEPSLDNVHKPLYLSDYFVILSEYNLSAHVGASILHTIKSCASQGGNHY